MISDARGKHVSPGIYTEEKDVTYSVKSLGITSLALVGETLYGPAFENIEIQNWSEFVDYFGGTSTEKFKDSGLHKYELPYIAKSYLEESKRLNVVRVLGLSGYHAGPYWVVGEKDENGKILKPIVILRSKMSYSITTDDCGIPTEDNAIAVVDGISGVPYTDYVYDAMCEPKGSKSGDTNNAHFAITVSCKEGSGYNTEYTYNLSLDPSDSTYIYNVLSNRPDTGTTPVYVEAVFESSFNGKELAVSSGETRDITEDVYFTYKLKESSASTEQSTKYVYNLTEVAFSADVMTSGNTLDIDKTFKPKEDKVYISGEEINSTYKYIKAKVFVSEFYDDYLEGYRAAQTPWIVSDAVVTENASSVRKLFKFITISDGDAANYQVKVSIQNIKPEEGTFDVIVRDFNDSDAAPIILERFSKCNLVEGDAG